ncbi:hypothetical protein BU16DRAFT_533716 [Lophium mytilinum]|uniref:Chitin-binding type-1 domain-containing protein n=1 Tax=Lophium mytilinum TaxID=390894 RepID=A0A6A6R8E0_9PEZI|nr:hypothetical protein BU16DRAFT_533716 [Lophium mytilinum]
MKVPCSIPSPVSSEAPPPTSLPSASASSPSPSSSNVPSATSTSSSIDSSVYSRSAISTSSSISSSVYSSSETSPFGVVASPSSSSFSTCYIKGGKKSCENEPSPTPNLPPGSISPDGTCGGRRGYTCKGSPFGRCCSRDGHCGNNDFACGELCQPRFGACEPPRPVTPPSNPISPDGTCGEHRGFTCKGSKFGRCCGPDGRCGNTPFACDRGCQSDYGFCERPHPPVITPKPTPVSYSKPCYISGKTVTVTEWPEDNGEGPDEGHRPPPRPTHHRPTLTTISAIETSSLCFSPYTWSFASDIPSGITGVPPTPTAGSGGGYCVGPVTTRSTRAHVRTSSLCFPPYTWSFTTNIPTGITGMPTTPTAESGGGYCVEPDEESEWDGRPDDGPERRA